MGFIGYLKRVVLGTSGLLLLSSQSFAACPLGLAVYKSSAYTIEFSQHDGEALTVSNEFNVVAGDLKLNGIVQWSRDVARPYGLVTYQCPDGDVTGDELDECTIWQGVIYSVGENGKVGLLPKQKDDAPETLIFSDFGWALANSNVWLENKLSQSPDDSISLSGCLE